MGLSAVVNVVAVSWLRRVVEFSEVLGWAGSVMLMIAVLMGEPREGRRPFGARSLVGVAAGAGRKGKVSMGVSDPAEVEGTDPVLSVSLVMLSVARRARRGVRTVYASATVEEALARRLA